MGKHSKDSDHQKRANLAKLMDALKADFKAGKIDQHSYARLTVSYKRDLTALDDKLRGL